jgi:hypothetical protein
MRSRDRLAPVWLIWTPIAAFAVIEALAWSTAGGIPHRPAVLVQVLSAWSIMIALAALASRRLGTMSERMRAQESSHEATMIELEQLQTQNAILQVIERSADVALAFQALASRIARLVPCDRAGLALLSENGQEFQTYTARVHDEERRTRPRPEVTFRIEQTILGSVVRSREPLIISDIAETAPDYLDSNLLHNSGFASALIVPLVSKGRVVGTINLVQRAKHAYAPADAARMQPIAEIFAVAVIAQQMQTALGKYHSMEAMSEVTLSIAADINSALQTIIGLCDLLERGYPDPNLQRDLSTVVRQAERIASLLDKMRAAAHERMKEVEAAAQIGIPTSPEAFPDKTKI